jgi:hypothetical protein
MRKLILFLMLLSPALLQAQIAVGVKAGLNLANVTSKSISTNMYTGYFVGGYISPKQKKVVGFRSELILSRQGYDYKTNTNTGKVDLDYLLLPQLLVLKFTKKFQVHLGGQIAFLLNAKVDSSGGGGNGSLFDYLSRFDYGAVGGFEVSPFSGFVTGSRINISLNNISKEAISSPNFISRDLIRNNVLQIYVGWRF